MCLNVDFKWLCDVTTKDLCHSFTCWELCVVLLIDGRRSFTVILFTCVVCCGTKVHCLSTM